MPVKLRLQRHGKKDAAFFHIVAADGRAPRDGKFIEKLGTYNPNTNPATIDIDFDRAIYWLDCGAVATNTCRAILSYRGLLYKRHLLGGVKKGALTNEQAEAKFQKWLSEKESKINNKISNLTTAKEEAGKKKMAEEVSRKEAIAAKVAAKSTSVNNTEETSEENTSTEENS
ncbi:MAG: 30S ribosomal protein S16 [Bacteroidota bacterium]|jgi:small subunit ribosomal protein S16